MYPKFFFHTLLAVFLLANMFSCQIRKQESDAQVSSQETKSESLSLVDFEYDEDQDKQIQFQDYSFHILDQGASTPSPFDYNAFTDEYTVDPSLLEISDTYELILADVNSEGRFFDLRKKEFLNQGSAENRCYSAAFENKSGVFFLGDLEKGRVESLFSLSNNAVDLAIAGRICVAASAKVLSFYNDGFFALPEEGIGNFVKILKSRGVEFEEDRGLHIGSQIAKGKAKSDPGTPRKVQEIQTPIKKLTPRSQESPKPVRKNEPVSVITNNDHIQFRGITTESRQNIANIDSTLTRSKKSLSKRLSQKLHSSDYAYEGTLGTDKKLKIKEKPLGEGTYGTVYEMDVVGKKGKKRYAMKVFNDEEHFITAQDSQNLAYELGDHPNFLRHYGTGKNPLNENQKAIYTELAGENLHEYFLTERKVKPVEQASAIWGILDGMEFLASKNFVHWDFKPENVLMGNDGNIKIIDLDALSMDTPMKIPTLKSKPFTIDHKAPERILKNGRVMCGTEPCGEPLNWTKSDAYSVGVSIVQIYLGKPIGDIYQEVMGIPLYKEIEDELTKKPRLILNDGVVDTLRDGSFKKYLVAKFPDDPFILHAAKFLEPDPRIRIMYPEFKDLIKDIYPRTVSKK